MTLKGETIMTGWNNNEFGTNGYSMLKVMSSPNGYYLGTTYTDEDGLSLPGTRESEYFANEKAATFALGHWNAGHPVKLRVL